MLQYHPPKQDSPVILGGRLAVRLAHSHLPAEHLHPLPVVVRPRGRGRVASPRGRCPQGDYGFLTYLVPGKVTRWGGPVWVFQSTFCLFRLGPEEIWWFSVHISSAEPVEIQKLGNVRVINKVKLILPNSRK